MTIKQQGGIFGRNPTFNDLTVDTVDINGGNIDNTVIGSNTPAAISGTTGQFNTSLNVDGAITADGLASSQKLEFNASEPALISTGSTAKVYATNSSFDGVNGSLVLQSRPVNGADVYIATGSTPKTVAKFFDGGNISFYDNTGTTAKLTWNAAAGNLAFASGNGIDFSATSGTGTSELFDDYEEGTWTPTYAPSTGSFTSITYGNTGGVYTKIGNICIVSGYISTSALDTTGGSGAIKVGGLPYGIAGSSGGTRDAWRGGSIGYSAGWSGERPSSVFASGGASDFRIMYRSNATSDSSYVLVADMDTSGSNEIAFTLTYRV